jgi:hypothetical protein
VSLFFLVFFFLILLGAKSEMNWSEPLPLEAKASVVYTEEPKLGLLLVGTVDPICLPSFACSTPKPKDNPLSALPLPDPSPFVDFATVPLQNNTGLELEEDLSACYLQLSECRSIGKWPPVFDLSEAKGYYFASGSDELSQSFISKLQDHIIPLIFRTILERKYNITVIEIVGHTDEQPVASTISNLDANLTLQLGGDLKAQPLRPSDNAGLGLARAVAVRRQIILEGKLRDFPIVVLSAGQSIETNGEIAVGATDGVGDAARRRIEIRLRGDAERIE